MSAANLHQLAVLFGFFGILFSPVASATWVSMRWDKAEAAYMRFEAQVARMLEPNAKTVPGNLCIRPYASWAAFHIEAEPLESASEFRLRVFGNGKLAAAAKQSQTIAATVEVPQIQTVAA
ncbi:hypothetical protein ACFQBQ_10470 [Granulicella cerasi]|uniref:Uncharacterized protein n=1 Tax=Granulicella cerasi TaxID=741063 RepID=A0ABW1Z9W8_9BACT|nr:hypothetical protein [Granulicella cerasi]